MGGALVYARFLQKKNKIYGTLPCGVQFFGVQFCSLHALQSADAFVLPIVDYCASVRGRHQSW